MWFLAILFVGSLVASLLLAPKPKTENARASGLNDLQFPRADQGSPVPLILGRVKMSGPNTTWVGDFEARAIKKKQKTGIFSSKKVIVGYTYYVGLDLCLALGECTLHKIVSDKDVIWTGNASADENVLNINLPNLYGGPEKGGGMVGTMRYYKGSTSQPKNAYLAGKIGAADTPAYRGFAHLVLEHFDIGESNQLRALWMEMSRYTDSLGLGAHAQVGDDMNPMEVLFQAFTLDWGGLDVSPDLLDLDSLRACGHTLFSEGNGMSVCVSSPNSGKDIANEVMRQVDGLMYQNPITGKMVMKLIRNDYNIADLPVFDETNIITIRNFTSKLWEDTVNQVRATFTDRSNDYATGTAMAQDMANINAQGRIRSITNSYPGTTVATTGNNLAARDLSEGSVPLLGCTMEINRQAAQLRPGDPFIWRWSAYGIQQVIMRVKTFDLGALTDNRIILDANQDDFAVNQTLFQAPNGPGSGAVAPSDPAVAAPKHMALEGAYFFAAATNIPISAQQGLVIASATAPAGSNEYDIYTSKNGGDYAESEEGVVYTPHATLVNAIPADSGMSTGIVGNVVITAPSDTLTAHSAADVASGAGLFYIGSELFAHEGVTVNGDSTVTLGNVRRALLDTVPVGHVVGDHVWFIEADNVVDDTFGLNDVVRVKIAPSTFSDQLDIGSAPYDSVTLVARAQRPLRPANVKFDGGAAFSPPGNGIGSHTITWSNRNRLLATIRGLGDSANEYEAGQQTVIRYKLDSGAWTQVLIAPGVQTYTFDAGASGTQVVSYEIYSTRDGLDSFSKWAFTAGVSGGAAGSAGGSSPDTGGSAPGNTTPSYTPPPSQTSTGLTASEAIAANSMVNIFNSGGAGRVRNANATDNSKPAQGYVKDAVPSGGTVTVYFDGENDNLSGLTPGVYYLSTNAGQITTAPPSASGNVVQRVGTATAAGSFIFEPGEPIGIA